MNLKYPPPILKKDKYLTSFYPFKYLSMLSLLLILVFSTGTFAQVKIKEKVEIKPQAAIALNKTASTHTITFVATWEATHREALVRNLSSCSDDNGSSGWVSGGTINHVISNAQAGSHSFQFAVNSSSQEGESGDLTWKIYLDGNLEKEGVYENAYWGGTGFRIGPSLYTPYRSTIIFDLDEEGICPGGGRGASVYAGRDDCESNGAWNPKTESVTFTITQGADHTSFLDPNGSGSKLNSITIPPDDFDEAFALAEFFTDPEVLNGSLGTVSVRAEAGSIIDEQTVTVDPNSGFESLDIDVWPDQDAMFHGEENEITLYVYINRFCVLLENVKYNVELSSGSNLGSLYNPQTGKKGKSLQNISHTHGEAKIVFIADGDRPTEIMEELILTVSASNPQIPSVQKSIMVFKTEIIVEFSKDYLTPGEEADIILSTENELGEKISFPTDQNFTIGIFENDNYANILKGDDTTKYKFLENTKQPFRILAEEEINLDSVNVRIYVDNGSVTDGGGGSGEVLANVQQKSSNISKVQAELDSISVDQIIRKRVSKLRNKVSGTTKLAKVSSVSSIDEGPEILVGYGDIDIKKGGCEEFACNESMIKPSFSFDIQPNGSFGRDACSTEQAIENSKAQPGCIAGITSFSVNDMNYEYLNNKENFTACYNQSKGIWQFGTTKPLYPLFGIISDVCLTNISNKKYKPLEDLSDINDPAIWNDPNYCAAKTDLLDHKPYPNRIKKGGYYFLKVIRAHEMSHVQDHEWLLDSLQNDFLYPSLEKFTLSCEDIEGRASSKEKAIKLFLTHLRKMMLGQTDQYDKSIILFEGFDKKLYNAIKKRKKQKFNNDLTVHSYERLINSRPIVKNTINFLINEFETIWDCN